jgi:hypothetical protein
MHGGGATIMVWSNQSMVLHWGWGAGEGRRRMGDLDVEEENI